MPYNTKLIIDAMLKNLASLEDIQDSTDIVKLKQALDGLREISFKEHGSMISTQLSLDDFLTELKKVKGPASGLIL